VFAFTAVKRGSALTNGRRRARGLVEAAHQRQLGHIGERAVGGEVRGLLRLVVAVFGAALRLRLAVGVEPVDKVSGEGVGQAQDLQEAPELRKMGRTHRPVPHQVVQIERALLVVDLAGELPIIHRHRRQAQRPGLAQVIDAARAPIVAQQGARPIDAGPDQRLRLDMLGAELCVPRPGALRGEHRRRSDRGERDHPHGEHHGDAALRFSRGGSHDFSANTRTSSSPEASTMRSRTACGSGGSRSERGHASTHVSSGSRYCNSNFATSDSTA